MPYTSGLGWQSPPVSTNTPPSQYVVPSGGGSAPSGVRNFFGRAVDAFLPGSQYDPQTGQYSNMLSGLAGFIGNRIAPGLGTLGQRLWQNRGGWGGGYTGGPNSPGSMNNFGNQAFGQWNSADIGAPGLGQNPFALPQGTYNRANPFSTGLPQRGGSGSLASRMANSRGATVLEGDAARDFFDGMKEASFQQKQTGADSFGSIYAK